jgi:hypothetical protein
MRTASALQVPERLLVRETWVSPRNRFDFDHRMCDIAIRERVVESGQNVGLPRTWRADHDNRKHLRSLPGRAETLG